MEMLKIPGLGPKTIKLFYDKLGISDVNALEHRAPAQNPEIRINLDIHRQRRTIPAFGKREPVG